MPQNPTISESDYLEVAGEQDKDTLVTAIKEGDTHQVSQMLRDGVVYINTCYEVHELPDREGLSPLMIACNYGRYDMAKLLLLEHGAKVDLQDSVGWSALMHTVRQGHFDIVKLLLHHGADVDLQSTKWDSARSLALCKEDSGMVSAIRESLVS
jgi:ankyrin repeat protein